MRKCKVLQVLLFNLILNLWVPCSSFSASDFPNPNPISFGLANLVCYPDHLLIKNQSQRPWHFLSGVARLYGIPELQPYTLRASGPAVGGHLVFVGNSITVGSYHDHTLQLGYGRMITNAVRGEVSFALSQIAIDNYGTSHSLQVNTRLTWRLQPQVQLSVAAFNLNNAHFGTGKYALPQRFAIGSKIEPVESAQVFLELEKDTRYPLQTRFGVTYHVYGPLALLSGFQSEPDILAVGFSLKASHFQGIASMQYHPDLGYSQCFGLAIQI
jgi:hypothetical protein